MQREKPNARRTSSTLPLYVPGGELWMKGRCHMPPSADPAGRRDDRGRGSRRWRRARFAGILMGWPIVSDRRHVRSSTPGRVTSALQAMLDGCHARPAHTGAMRVLVVEDHATLADRIAQGLRQAGMAVDAVHDGAAALDAAAQTAYDVIVLDRDLPVVHGDRVCRAVAGSGPRILMLTAAADVEDRVDGLELGADDYLRKPFAFAELVARVRALSRRAPSAPPVLRRGDLTVDRARHRASRGSRPLSLTRKEFGVLETLLAADGALVSAEELLEHVWDANADPFSNIVSVTHGPAAAQARRPAADRNRGGQGIPDVTPPAADRPGTADPALYRPVRRVRGDRRGGQLHPGGAAGGVGAWPAACLPLRIPASIAARCRSEQPSAHPDKASIAQVHRPSSSWARNTSVTSPCRTCCSTR